MSISQYVYNKSYYAIYNKKKITAWIFIFSENIFEFVKIYLHLLAIFILYWIAFYADTKSYLLMNTYPMSDSPL